MSRPSIVGQLAWNAIEHHRNETRTARERQNLTHPLTQLGMTGIRSVFTEAGLRDLEARILSWKPPGWSCVRHLDTLAPVSDAPLVVCAGERTAVIEVTLAEPTPAMAHRIDQTADALRALSGQDVTAVLCTVGDARPTELPCPSGRSVTATGTAWAMAVLYRALQRDGTVPLGRPEARLELRMAAAEQDPAALAVIGPGLYSGLDNGWWLSAGIILGSVRSAHPRVRLDLVACGPSGVFAVECVRDSVQRAQNRLDYTTAMLRSHLPPVDVVPVLVMPSGAPMTDRTGPHGSLLLRPRGTAVLRRLLPRAWSRHRGRAAPPSTGTGLATNRHGASIPDTEL